MFIQDPTSSINVVENSEDKNTFCSYLEHSYAESIVYVNQLF